MLYPVQGRSGTGKTYYVMNVLSQLAKEGNDKLLYLIPEQSSFESETAFLKLLGPRLCRNVNVMSFTRLYDMVTRKTGGASGTPIDDGVRKIMMAMALEDCADKLEIYKRQALKPQFTDYMLNAVKEFKMCGITSDDLREKSRAASGTDLSSKLKEISLVADVYNAHVAKSYIDPLDNNARLEKILGETRFFEGYTIAADGFSGFTAQEQKILDLMMEQCSDFYITLSMDCEREDELFFTVNRTRRRIIQSAKKYSVPVSSPVKLTENHRIGTNGLKTLEGGIYRIGSKPFSGSCDDVTVAGASDIFEECGYISEQIKRLTLGGECRYGDIAVVCRNSEKYRGILDAAFDSCGISYFMSKPQAVGAKPLMLLALSALEYAVKPSDCGCIFTIAKCGLLPLSDCEVSELENYVFTWSINGRRFAQDFEASPRGFGSEKTREDYEALEKINSTRRKLYNPLCSFMEKIKEPSALKISTALYELLLDYNVPEAIRENGGAESFADEQARLWDMLMDMLNKMVLTLGERAVSVKRYYELFKLMVGSADISDIPQTLDQVLVGTADSIRLSSPKVVFVIGAIEGEFPHMPVPSGLFSDAERRTLISLDLPLYDAAAELFLQEKYLVYNAVSAPTKRLFITYYKSDLQGGQLQRSGIVTEALRLLPDCRMETASDLNILERIYCEKNAFESYALLYGESCAEKKALEKYFSAKPEYKSRLEALKRAADKSDFRISDKNISAALFGKNKRLSASQIENFYKCPFQYFCNYGLRLSERKRAKIDAPEFGSIVHYLLENVLTEYMERNCKPYAEKELEELLNALLQKYITEKMGGEDDKTERFKHLYYRLSKSMKSLLGHISQELAQSEFKPYDFELSVGGEGGIPAYTLTDSSMNTVAIRGKIDRVDVMKTDGADYVRIVDYKTGTKTFRVSDVMYGLNMQMLIYLSAVSKNSGERYGDKIIPAGILYMPSTVTSVTVPPTADKSTIENEHNKKLKMNGLIVDEAHIITGMEEKAEGKYIPAELTPGGTVKPSSRESVISAADLRMIFNKVDEKIIEMSDRLNGGDIAAVPVTGSYDACAWCVYKAVCGHKETGAGRCVSNMKKEEVLEQLRNDGQEGKEE